MKLTKPQVIRLRQFAVQHGRLWKRKLSDIWAEGADANDPLLRQIRNGMGASGLKAVSLAEEVFTPSNKLKIRSVIRRDDYCAEVDSLYEIADAEFTSNSVLCGHVQNMKERCRDFKRMFVAHVTPKVNRIAKREGFDIRAIDIKTVCEKLYHDRAD